MKTLTSLFSVALVALLPVAALAQTTAPSRTDRTTGSGSDRGTMSHGTKSERPVWNNTEALHETGDLIGTEVHDQDGKTIGKVDALLIDPKDGRVVDAVVGLGGVLGLGKDKVVVPWSDLRMSGHENGRKATITLDRSTLDQAPKYVKSRERQPSASPATGRSGGSDSGKK